MAATDTTQESTLIIPEDQVGNVSKTESEGKTVWEFSGVTKGVEAEINEGKSVFRGEAVRRSTFSFNEPNTAISFRNNVNKAEFNGTDRGESLRFAANANNLTANMKGGPDSILFGRNSSVNNAKIDLGSDNDIDIVEFAGGLRDVKESRITNFGKDDILKIGGQEYTYQDLQNEDFGSKLTIKFKD